MRLIDADEVLADAKHMSAFRNDLANITDLEILVNGQETVDAVPVVRCKDCKHSRDRNENEKGYLVEGVLICTSFHATDDGWKPVFPEHFCSYGERKGGANNE